MEWRGDARYALASPLHPGMGVIMNALQTPLCLRLGIDLPIVQAPIGSASTWS